MRIKGLTPILVRASKLRILKSTTVVIDGIGLFFSLYRRAQIPYALGCESDTFATFLRSYLDKFKRANLRCYFVFASGFMDKHLLNNRLPRDGRLDARNYDPSREFSYDDIVKPIFAKDIWFETLDEMGFKYVFCKDYHVTECISLALKLNCPVIGNNMEYFFSQVQYIPELNITLDEHDNNLLCYTFTLSSFLKKYYLTEEKVITFLMMTDHHILDEQVFKAFFERNNMLTRYKNIDLQYLLAWLSKRNTEQISTEVFKFLSKNDQSLYDIKKTALEKLIQKRKNPDDKLFLFVTDINKAKFTQNDPNWFEKGVYFGYIAALPYVDLFRSKVVKASNFIEDYEQGNSIMVSIDIVKYAFDLLTNFEGGEISVEYKKIDSGDETDGTLTYNCSIRKPDYEATLCVFENGWDKIKQLNLFKHFITESLQTFDFALLDAAPADCKLLLIALAYFSRKKPEAKLEIYSILLSYVMLGVVHEKVNMDADAFKTNDESVSKMPFLDYLTDKDLVTAADCEVAVSLMSKYFKLKQDELCEIFDRKTLHPLVEFTRILEELNSLNKLCGSEFDPTVFCKTYNGTFVYKILYAMAGLDGLEFIKIKLSPAPTVLAFLIGIHRIYQSIL